MKTFRWIFLGLFISCVNAQPTVIWSKYFGGNQGQARSIQQTADGGYVVAGVARNPHPEAVDYQAFDDGFVVKLDAEFNLVWSQCYGSALGEYINNIRQTPDGGYVFVGMAQKAYAGQPATSMAYNAWIVKLSANGEVQWEKKYGGSHDDEAKSIAIHPDGHYIVSGYARSVADDLPGNAGFADVWSMKINSSTGDLIFSKNYGGVDNDFSNSVIVNDDGTAVAAGETFSESGDVTCRTSGLICESDIWVVKTAADGSVIWNRCFTSNAAGSNFFNTGYQIIKTNDGGYIVVGNGNNKFAGNTFGLTDVWVIKLSADGTQEWKNWYGGSQNDYGYAIRQTPDGGYIVAGASYSSDSQVDSSHLGDNSSQNGWLIRINAIGQLQWQRVLGSGNFGLDYLSDILVLGDNDFVAAGKAGGSNGDCAESNGRGFWITKLNYNPLTVSEFNGQSALTVSPNPVLNTIALTAAEQLKHVSISDLSGRLVIDVKGDNLTQIDLSMLDAGMYMIQAVSVTGKIQKARVLKK